MKKLAFSVFVIFVISIASAQDTTYRRTEGGAGVQFGLKGGVNLAKLVQSGPEEYDYRTGFYVGGLAHIHLTPSFAIQPEVVYSKQGGEYSAGTNKFDYINIPVLFQYMFHNGLRLQTGPQLGILTGAKFENASDQSETSIKRQLQDTDFSWSFGAGFLSASGLGIDARYNLGITDITAEGSIQEVKNRVWQFGIFYQFRR